MSESTPLDEANIASVKAQESLWKTQAIGSLVSNGFSHESAVKAVTSGDLTQAVKAA